MFFHLGFFIAFWVSLLLTVSVAAQDRPKLFLGASSKTLGYSPLWVGTKKGFFEQQGLDVQLVSAARHADDRPGAFRRISAYRLRRR